MAERAKDHRPSGIDEEAFNRLVSELRPRLHRYLSRMTGSVIDGEDVVQEALLKAIEALPRTDSVGNPEGWLFRIAHNAALDFLRRRTRQEAGRSDEDIEMIAAPSNPVLEHESATASLRTFMRLPVAQRSAVILRDVLGHSLEEAQDIVGGSLPAIKAALQRGRTRLHEFANEPDELVPPKLSGDDRRRLVGYVERFNARDFDSIRSMLAEDVRLDLVNKLQAKGRSRVGEYFHRYSLGSDWRLFAGFVDGRPAILVFDPDDLTGPPQYFMLLDWHGDSVLAIRDFRFARYALDGAEFLVLR